MLYVSSFIALGPSESGPGGLLDEAGVGERMHREGLVHEGFVLLYGISGADGMLYLRDGSQMKLAKRQIAEKLGYRLVDHRMELYGVRLERDA